MVSFATSSAAPLFRLGPIVLLSAVCALAISACADDATETHATTSEGEASVIIQSDTQAERPATPTDYSALSFDVQLQTCERYVCTLLPVESKTLADYNEETMDFIGIGAGDTQAKARELIKSAFDGVVGIGLGNTSDPDIFLLHAQAQPRPGQSDPEYDIVVLTDGPARNSAVIAWGGRVRCAPVTDSTEWQTDTC